MASPTSQYYGIGSDVFAGRRQLAQRSIDASAAAAQHGDVIPDRKGTP